MHRPEVILERGVAELVDGASLPEHLSVQCVLQQA
jgi:hypothetical protein